MRLHEFGGGPPPCSAACERMPPRRGPLQPHQSGALRGRQIVEAQPTDTKGRRQDLPRGVARESDHANRPPCRRCEGVEPVGEDLLRAGDSYPGHPATRRQLDLPETVSGLDHCQRVSRSQRSQRGDNGVVRLGKQGGNGIDRQTSELDPQQPAESAPEVGTGADREHHSQRLCDQPSRDHEEYVL